MINTDTRLVKSMAERPAHNWLVAGSSPAGPIYPLKIAPLSTLLGHSPHAPGL